MLPSLFLIVGIIVPITDKGDKDKRRKINNLGRVPQQAAILAFIKHWFEKSPEEAVGKIF